MSEQTIAIKANGTNHVLATGKRGDDVLFFEGAWYFAPTAVDMTYLSVSERTYTCPYKGTCYWIDLIQPDGSHLENVAFTYFETNPDYQFVLDKIGFYYGKREGTYHEMLSEPTT